MTKLDILDVIRICAEYINNPTDVEMEQNFTQLKSELIVRSYMPIAEKAELTNKVLSDIRVFENSGTSVIVTAEMALTFDLLFAYTNVTNAITDFVKYDAFYDVVWASGLCDYILEFCEKDYRRSTDFVYHVLSADNIMNLVDAWKGIDSKALERYNEEFKKFKLEVDPELIKNLGNIAVGNDPLLRSIKETVEEIGASAIKQ